MPKPSSVSALIPAAALSPPQQTGEVQGIRRRLYYHPHTVRVAKQFVDALGGPDAFYAELVTAPDLSPAMQTFVELAFDPSQSKMTFAGLCEKAGLTMGDVFAAFRDALAAKATVLAMQVASQKAIQVVEAIATDALEHLGTCLACAGTGKQTIVEKYKTRLYPKDTARKHNPMRVQIRKHHVVCPKCAATGKVLLAADRDAQKMLLKLVGLDKGAQFIIQQNTQTNVVAPQIEASTGAASLVQLQQAVQSALFGRGAVVPPGVIDAESVPVPGLDGVDSQPADLEEQP